MSVSTDQSTYIFNCSCQAGTGILAAISTFLAERDCYICAVEQFDDEDTNKFFMRAVFRRQSNSPKIEEIRQEFTAVAEKFDMKWSSYNSADKVKTIIMVSKFDHCLDDLLYRDGTGCSGQVPH